MKSNIAIIIPCYNEDKVITGVIENLKKDRTNDFIIVVDDDGSVDNSLSILKKIPNIYLLAHDINLGQGAALQTGIEMAKKLKCKYLVTFDSDGQHSSKDIESFYQTIVGEDLDIVLGSRFMDNRTSNISNFKKFFLKLSTVFTYLTTGIKLSDSHNGFRIVNIERNLDFELKHNGMSHASEVIELINSLKLKYKELPCHISYTDYSKQKGQSLWNSINIVIEIFVQRFIK